MEKKELVEYMKKWRKKCKLVKLAFILEYKSQRKCFLCGWNEHTEILEFHHKEKEIKPQWLIKSGQSRMAQLIHGSQSLEILKKEIEKCILLCPNCHTWIHYKEKY